jgi:hypothetical protein
MGVICKKVLKFKSKYPNTIAWRLQKNASVIEKHLNPGEEVRYAFAAQKNDNVFNIFETAVIVLTSKRILIGRKRVFFGYFLNSITPDMFNDLKVSGGLIWGKVYIDTVKEYVTLSNISNDALTEIETEVSTYMMEEKKKYANELSDGD